MLSTTDAINAILAILEVKSIKKTAMALVNDALNKKYKPAYRYKPIMYSVDAVMQSTPYDGVASVLNSIGIDGMRIVTDATEQPKQDVIVENKQSAISDVAKLLYRFIMILAIFVQNL